MGDNSNMPHPKCIRSKKTPVWNNKLVERGIPHIPNRKGAMQNCGVQLRIKSRPKKCPARCRSPLVLLCRLFVMEICALVPALLYSWCKVELLGLAMAKQLTLVYVHFLCLLPIFAVYLPCTFGFLSSLLY